MSKTFFINDLFWTFQGEGKYSGVRALFIRMPFCNLSCSWCDTTFDSYKKINIDEFKEFINKEKSRFSVVTGGEPLMNKHTPVIVSILHEYKFFVACETNGTFKSNADFDFITCSPKRDNNYKIDESLYPLVNEFKYVVDDSFDFSILKRHDQDCAILSLSPEFNNMSNNIEKITDFIKDNPRWKLNLQTHKWIGIP